MAKERHLSRAPITEALVDIRIQPRAALETEHLAQLENRLSASYPQHDSVYAAPSDSPGSQLGWMFRSANGLQVAQFRSDGFTFNRLSPYTSWDELFPHAMELWKLYVELLRPEQVGRLAVRFINRLATYEPETAFGLLNPPHLPNGLRVSTREFLSRLVVLDEDTDHAAVITTASDAELTQAKPALILDIDAFSERSYEPQDLDLSRTLEELRRLKNKLFFGMITEDTARLYE